MMIQSQPWSVPFAVSDIAEDGSHVDLTADPATCAAVAKAAGLRSLPELTARFDIVRTARGIRVTGTVSATVGQTCVVTLDPIENRVEEDIRLLFVPDGPAADAALADDGPDDIEQLNGETIDLGALAVEFLILGIDPYPRKPGAEFSPIVENPADTNPFSALAALKKPSKN